MSTKGLRKCCHCGSWFRPHPRNAYHQRFCMKGDCRAASKRASQQKWHRKNPGYFRGEQYVKKVQAWRRAHPGYWKGGAAAQSCGRVDTLQDLLMAQGFDNKEVSVFRNYLNQEISRPLQDVLSAQGHALVGLTAMISGEALQEDIAGLLSTCYERGQRLGGPDLWRVGRAWMNKEQLSDERTKSDIATTAAAH